jgi:hypothetical protein
MDISKKNPLSVFSPDGEGIRRGGRMRLKKKIIQWIF